MQLSWQARVAQSMQQHIDAQVCWLPLAAAADVPAHACRHLTTNKSRSGLVTKMPQLKVGSGIFQSPFAIVVTMLKSEMAF
jgi:hypothetical protein